MKYQDKALQPLNQPQLKVPPDGGYGWVIVVAYALANIIIIPVMLSFGLIYKDELPVMGISATDASVIINTFSAFGMSLGLINGPLLRFYGYRKVGIAAGIFFSVGIFLTAWARTFGHFMITYSIIGAAGMGMTTSAFSLALNSYFRKRRNKAVGIATTLTGLGPIVFPQIITFLLDRYDTWGCMVILGGISLHIILAAVLLQPIKWHLVDGALPEPAPQPEIEMQSMTAMTILEEADANNDSITKLEADQSHPLTNTLDSQPIPHHRIHLDSYDFTSDEDMDDYLDTRRISIEHDIETQSIYGLDITPGLSRPGLHSALTQSISNFQSKQDLTFNRQYSQETTATQLGRTQPRLRRQMSLGANIKEHHNQMLQAAVSTSTTSPPPDCSTSSGIPGKGRWFDISRETVNLGSSLNIFNDRNTDERRVTIREPGSPTRKSIQFPAGAFTVIEEGQKILEKGNTVNKSALKPTTSPSYHQVQTSLPSDPKKTFSYRLKRFGKRTVHFFDLTLLRDPIYLNMMLGMSVAVFAEINFSLLTPFILSDMGYSTEQIASVMSALAITDIIFRFLAPFIGDLCKQPPRIMYMLSLITLILTRSLVYTASTYTSILIVGMLLGVAKGVRTVYMSLVIPDYIPIERLASASGIQMITNGVLLLLAGPILGWIRDLTGSYQYCIVFINAVTMTTILMWTVELVYVKHFKK